MNVTSLKTILVIGATGQQGGAVARELIENGWAVRALVRDLNKPAAQFLQKLGVEMVQGDLDNTSSIQKAMKDVYGVFNVQALHIDDLEKEMRHGKAVADCAKKAGVSHFVYSSVAGANRNTGITAFENKGEIEQYILSLDLPFTILRPVMFMENFRFTLQKVNGQIILPYKGDPETKVQMIAVQDIGVFARKVLENPKQYTGKALEIAGDELTVKQLEDKISKYFGIPAQSPTSAPESAHEHDGVKATLFFIKEGYKADIKSLRQLHPQLLNFESWLYQSNIQF
nr:NmrA/HSCARG family protein [Shimazuella alba]